MHVKYVKVPESLDAEGNKTTSLHGQNGSQDNHTKGRVGWGSHKGKGRLGMHDIRNGGIIRRV